jgi:tRNA dimethylallyltransferase
VPDEVVRRSEQTYDDLGEAGFRAALAGRDLEAADRISPGDRQRLVRAWAVAEATGRALSDWRNATTTAPLSPEDWTGLVVEPPRADLYRRCDLRVRTMVQAGALDEAARLQARGLPPELPVMRALGVRPFAAHAAGSLDWPPPLRRFRETRAATPNASLPGSATRPRTGRGCSARSQRRSLTKAA